MCPKCKTTLGPAELIPILSYLFQRGKCKSCKERISIRYPAVEVATGVLFAANYIYFFGLMNTRWDWVDVVSFVARLVFIGILMLIFVYDLMYMEIPDQVVLPGIVVALVADIAQVAVSFWQFRSLTESLPIGKYLLSNTSFINSHLWEIGSPYLFGILAGLVLAAIFYVIVLISQERAMGGGDIKLAILLGLILPWPLLVPAMYVGFIVGATVGILVLLLRRGKMKTLIPLAPFLVTGVWTAMYFGADLIRMFSVFRLY